MLYAPRLPLLFSAKSHKDILFLAKNHKRVYPFFLHCPTPKVLPLRQKVRIIVQSIKYNTYLNGDRVLRPPVPHEHPPRLLENLAPNLRKIDRPNTFLSKDYPGRVLLRLNILGKIEMVIFVEKTTLEQSGYGYSVITFDLLQLL